MKNYKKDYIFITVIKLCGRINAKNEDEAKETWYKELKKQLNTDTFDYCPKRKDIKLIDIVLNRKKNNIYGDDISTGIFKILPKNKEN